MTIGKIKEGSECSEIVGVVLRNSWLPKSLNRLSLYTYEGIGNEYLIEQNEFEAQLQKYIRKTAKIKGNISLFENDKNFKKSIFIFNFSILKDELFDEDEFDLEVSKILEHLAER